MSSVVDKYPVAARLLSVFILLGTCVLWIIFRIGLTFTVYPFHSLDLWLIGVGIHAVSAAWLVFTWTTLVKLAREAYQMMLE